MQWQWKQVGTGASSEPQMHLQLVDTTKNNSVFYETDCTGVVSQAPADVIAGTLGGVRCWWAGGGDDYVAVMNGDALVIRHRTVDEESGYGQWTEIH
jgi:hypothetical protein